MKTILYIALLLAVTAKTYAQNAAFEAGENLTYRVSYSVIFLQPNVATVTFRTINSNVSGTPAYRVTAVAEVDSKWKWFFDMRDEYNTWLDRSTLRPLYFSNNIREGNYRFTSSYLYDWPAMQVTSEYKNLRINIPHKKVMPLEDRSYDGVAMLYNLRSTISEMKPGETDYIDVVMSDTIKRLQYRFIGPEERDIEGFGRYRTLKFSCQLTNAGNDREAFADGSEFFIWFSDDKNHIPMYVESPIRVGSIKGYLTSYQGLKYPLDGKVK